MIVTIKKNTPKQEVERLMQQLTNRGLKMYYTEGNNYDVIGLLGDVTAVDITWLKSFVFVQNVARLAEPYKLASRLFHPEDTVVDVGGIKIGGEEKLVIIGGPCAVESKEQILRIANEVKEAGAKMLRAGAYKPRTSPYAFQGLKGAFFRFL